jgi:hypothetical protein
VAAWSAGEVKTYSLKLTKGLRSRSGEEAIVSSLVLRALAEQSRVDFDVPMHLAGPERVEVGGTRYADPIAAVLAGHVETATISLDGSASADVPVTGGVLPGSFDPIHEGHRQLLAVASDILSAEVTLELSVTNADKPPLSETELRRRLAQLRGKWTAVISRAPVFSRKAALFPGCTFVIGWDTAVRLFEPRYYGGDELEMLKALDRIRGLGCRFLIAGREDGGVFRTLADVPVPAGFEKMFTAIPESLFRFNISSTELRPANGKP